MSVTAIAREIQGFLADPPSGTGLLHNERSLQLELGIFFRSHGYTVEFERPFRCETHAASTRKPKRDLDILVYRNGCSVAIELKVPLAGRVPETMYDFCADIAFVESIVRSNFADFGFCLLITNEQQFWDGALREGGIYNFFRRQDAILAGTIQKPTGGRDTTVSLYGSYPLASGWRGANERLMSKAKYVMVKVGDFNKN